MMDIIGKQKMWDQLFQPTDFFSQYKHFLVIEVFSNSEDDQSKWFGLVQSRVRHFIGDIERASKQLVHLWPKEYPSQGDESTDKKPNSCFLFIGLFLGMEKKDESIKSCDKFHTEPLKSSEPNNGGVKVELNLTDPIRQFVHETTKRAKVINIWNEGMEVKVVHVKRKQLMPYLPPDEREKLSQKLTKKKENVKSIFQQAVNGIEKQAANDKKVATENVNNNSRNVQTNNITRSHID